jgi:nucleoid DNA-binding protein
MKTVANKNSVNDFLNEVVNVRKKADSFTLLELMKSIPGEEPIMWGDSIIGFGRYHYRHKSGREGRWFLTGFSPRVQSLTFYIMSGFDEYKQLLDQLGKYKTGKSSYINNLSDVYLTVLEKLIHLSVKHISESN